MEAATLEETCPQGQARRSKVDADDEVVEAGNNESEVAAALSNANL